MEKDLTTDSRKSTLYQDFLPCMGCMTREISPRNVSRFWPSTLFAFPIRSWEERRFSKAYFFYATANKVRIKIPLKISSHSSYHSCHAHLMLLLPISEEVSQKYFVGKPTHPHVSYTLNFLGACTTPEMTPYARSFMEYSILLLVEMPAFECESSNSLMGRRIFCVEKSFDPWNLQVRSGYGM